MGGCWVSDAHGPCSHEVHLPMLSDLIVIREMVFPKSWSCGKRVHTWHLSLLRLDSNSMSSNFLSLGPSWKPMFKYSVISVCSAILNSLQVVNCIHLDLNCFQYVNHGGAFF